MSSHLADLRELNQQAWGLCRKDSPRAIELARQAQRLLPDCSDAQPRDEYECWRTQAYCLDVMSQPAEALPLGLKARQLAEQIGEKYHLVYIENLLGRIYWHIDDYATSMDFYLHALKLAQTEHYPDLEISLINGLGLVQYGLGNYPEALGYFQACLAQADADNLAGRADANNNIAYVLHMLDRDQDALPYGLAALELNRHLGTATGTMETLHSLGAIQFALGNHDQAMAFLVDGLAVARQTNSQLLALTYAIEISRLHRVQGRLDQAEAEFLQALQTAERINSLTNLSLIHERLVEVYKDKRDYASALAHFEAFHAIYKKIFNDQSDRRVKNLEILHQVEITRQQADLYRELADTDFLTSLVNRRRLLEIAEAAWQRAAVDHSPLAIILLDIDHFKAVNDSLGHKAGDVVLTAVAASLKQALRQGDVAGRYGGEEFIVLALGISADQCGALAERLRLVVAQLAVPIDQTTVRVTISLGVACLAPERALPLDDLINQADAALYQAKQRGRDRVVVWDDQSLSAGSGPAS